MRQTILLVLMLLVGVFLGIDSVEKNMHKMQGTVGAPRAIQVTPVDGKIQITVLGQDVPTGAIDQKQIKTVTNKVTQGGTLLSQMSNQLGLGIRYVTRGFLETVFAWVD